MPCAVTLNDPEGSRFTDGSASIGAWLEVAGARLFSDAGLELHPRSSWSAVRSIVRRNDAEFQNRPALLAEISQELPITARPGGGRVIGSMPEGSRFFGVPHKAWVLDRTDDGRNGKVTVPYTATPRTGWIRLAGLSLSRTPYAVRADLSRRLLVVLRRGREIMRFPTATGAPDTPTPLGRYFVTDRVPADPAGPFGAFAFGISGVQPLVASGWGDQLAIHGTNDPGSIGTAVSDGCLRVSGRALQRLKPLLDLGTPVIIRP